MTLHYRKAKYWRRRWDFGADRPAAQRFFDQAATLLGRGVDVVELTNPGPERFIVTLSRSDDVGAPLDNAATIRGGEPIEPWGKIP